MKTLRMIFFVNDPRRIMSPPYSFALIFIYPTHPDLVREVTTIFEREYAAAFTGSNPGMGEEKFKEKLLLVVQETKKKLSGSVKPDFYVELDIVIKTL